jgi:hypothetical protein
MIEYKKCVLILPTTFVWNIFHSKKNSAIYHNKPTQVFMYRNRDSCQILIKFSFSRQIFEKYWNIKFHENLPIGTELFYVDGRTDRHDKSNSRF